MTAWVAGTFALVNVYPTLFPWAEARERLLGVLICVLVAAYVARSSQLAAAGRLDGPLTLVAVGVICVISFSAVIGGGTGG